MNRSRRVIVLIMLLVLTVTLAGTFMTRGVMAYLPFLQARKGTWTGAYVPLGVVDQRPWQTAAALATLAQSAEERKLARDAERLADVVLPYGSDAVVLDPADAVDVVIRRLRALAEVAG